MSTDGFLHPVIMVPRQSGEDSIYKMEGLDDTIMSNYLRTVKYGSYIYSVIMSMMVSFKTSIMGGWVRDTLSNCIPSDIDMYVHCPIKGRWSGVNLFVERLLTRLFTHIVRLDKSFKLCTKKIVNHVHYGGMKYEVNVDNETIIMIDLNIFGVDGDDASEYFNPYNNIDFVQNCLMFEYNKQLKSIVLTAGRKLKEFNPLVQAYITKQPVFNIVLMMVGFAHIKMAHPAINMIKSFLGDEWQLIYGSLFTLWKSKELFACHMQCDHTINSDTRLARSIKNRCNKFKKRDYKLCNTRFCCKSCCFDQSRIPDGLMTETNTYHLDPIIKLMPPVATVQVSVGSRYSNTSMPEQKPMQLIHCNKGRHHVMMKGNEKKVKRSNVQHLTEVQKNALDMPDMTNRQLDSMLNIRMPKKVPKSSKRWTYFGPDAKTGKSYKSGPKYSKKHADSWMKDECGEF